MKFKVEAAFSVDDTACVAARRIEGGDFSLSASSRLDGVPLQQLLEIPRKLLRPEHGLDLDMFVFALADSAALSRFHKHDVVELTP
jgi:hypothetical protein